MANGSWIGQTLHGRYQIHELLGQGGMSSVYKANDPNLRRVVAVKMIHPHLSTNPDFVRRFEEEAAAVAQLRHENIVQVYDFNHDGDVYYMVLEFIPGETLQQRLSRLNSKNRRLDMSEAVTFISQIGEAISYAHGRGMIHRDIKPANIMLDVYGKAVLMDFGIARILGGQMHTATGAVVGTAMYMSPEQIKGEKVDERADIYSLGVTLFEAVSGKPPFEADSAMTLMMMHLNDPVPDIRDLYPQVPDPLVAVIMKALEKKRENRYQSAAEMVGALRGVQAYLANPPAPQIAAVETRVEPPLETPVAAYPVPQPAPAAPESAQTSNSGGRWDANASPKTPIIDENVFTAEQQPQPKPLWRRPIVLSGCAALLLVLVVGTVLAGRAFYGAIAAVQATPTETLTTSMAVTGEQTAIPEILPTATTAPTATSAPLASYTAAAQPTQAVAAAVSAPPTPTVPSDRPYVRINGITIDNGRFVVDYETFGYQEKLPGMHVHFFYDNITPDQAGAPGKGPWILYGGPRPFRGYTVQSKPANATRMCALVANPDHSVQSESGNCFELPK